ncbi:MAG: hypothetical protein RR293_03800 [Bacteroidales bacterium]
MKTKLVFSYLCMAMLFSCVALLMSGCNKDEDKDQHLYSIKYISGNTNFESNPLLQFVINESLKKIDNIDGTEKDVINKFNAICDVIEGIKYNDVPLLGETTCTLGLFEYVGVDVKYADKEIVRRTISFTKDTPANK